MIIVLNGPLGIGKSTLAEVLTESIDGCVMLDGDRLIAANPPYDDAYEHLHATIALLVAHHYRYGYRHFVLDYIWRSTAELDDLRHHLLLLDDDIRCFLLTLPEEENLKRIEQRASVRAINELAFERQIFAQEREILATSSGLNCEPFDVSAAPEVLVKTMLQRLGLS